MNVNSKHTEDEVLRTLWKKQDVKIVGDTIYLLTGKDKKHLRKNDLGNKSWGKIDFLCHYKGYKRAWVNELPKF